eukprot:6208264-Pleurochrysis_carterae.AAC.1
MELTPIWRKESAPLHRQQIAAPCTQPSSGFERPPQTSAQALQGHTSVDPPPFLQLPASSRNPSSRCAPP